MGLEYVNPWRFKALGIAEMTQSVVVAVLTGTLFTVGNFIWESNVSSPDELISQKIKSNELASQKQLAVMNERLAALEDRAASDRSVKSLERRMSKLEKQTRQIQERSIETSTDIKWIKEYLRKN